MRNISTILFFSLFITTLSFAQPAPNFQVITTEGQRLDLYEDYLDQDKTVLLELFWEGCPPCNAFAPLLGDLYKEWGSGTRDVEFIALDILLNEDDEDVRAFQNRHGHTWPGVSAEGGSIGAASPYTGGTVYGSYLGTPTIVIIAPDGTVAYNVNGFNRDQTGIALLDEAIRATGAKKPTDDTSGPVFTTEPNIISDISCSDTLPAQQILMATDTCGVTVTPTVDSFTVDNCNGYAVTYRWTATDNCDNSTVLTRTFSVLPDTLLPVFDKEPNPIANVNCGDPFPDPEILTATSACGPATVTFSIDSFTLDLCNGNTITYRWLATSACGRTAETSMSFITTFDRQGPVFDSEPQDIRDIRCTNTLPIPETLTASSNCTDVSVVFSIDDFEEDFCNGYPITYRWTASDRCGRSTVVTKSFNVLPDDSEVVFNKEPDALADVACGEAFPNVETLTAAMNCSMLPVTFSINASNSEPCGNTVTYQWTATDPCGNETMRAVSFEVGEAPNMTTDLMGGVVNRDSEGLGEVTLQFSGGVSTSITTNESGQFTVPNLPVNESYVIIPEKIGDLTEGVTTLDIVITSRHILGIEPFTEDAQFIAADVNLSDNVTAFDIVLMRQAILRITDSFSAGSWRFIPERIELASLANVGELSFMGVKIGDVNNSLGLQNDENETRNTTDKIQLLVENQSFEAGELVEAVLQAPNQASFIGFQYTLEFDETTLDLLTIENSSLSNFNPINNTNLLQKENGKVAISWSDVNASYDDQLFKLQFKAIKNGKLSEVLHLTSNMIKAEAYMDEKILDIDLQFQNSATNLSDIQVFPNPNSGDFILQTYTETAAELTIDVLGLEGKVLQTFTFEATNSGLQNIPIQLNTPNAGMYWITIAGEGEIKKIEKFIAK